MEDSRISILKRTRVPQRDFFGATEPKPDQGFRAGNIMKKLLALRPVTPE